MKKLILTLVAAGAVMAASADRLSQPAIFYENFAGMSANGDKFDEGWITYGNGAVPGEVDQYYFNPTGKGPYYSFLDQGLQSMVMATTDFPDGTPADQWLITPQIEVPYSTSILSYTVCTYNPRLSESSSLGNSSDPNHAYKIMVSETGVEKEDFVEVFSGTVRCASSSLIETNPKWMALEGYEGKKVHLAFVVTGLDQGFTGFTDLSWNQYYIDAENLTNEVAEVGEKITIDYNMKMRTPVACSTVNAQLFIDGDLHTDKDFRKAWGATAASTPIQRMKFPDVAVAEGKPIDYRLVLTPNFEGAQPTVIEGSIGIPKVKYPNNVVIEELTGTKCGYCPVGIAGIEYFNETYNVEGADSKVIAIAIHNTTFGADPMSVGNERYNNAIATLDGATNMPAGIYNRMPPRGCMPINAAVVESQIKAKSNNYAVITDTYMPLTEKDIAGKKAVVKFDVRNGFDCTMRGLSASVVVIENNVQGTSAAYNQTNNIANQYNNGQEVAATYAAQYGSVPGMAPFFDKFVGRGALASNPIRFDKMQYNEVSRGIFPSFEGIALSQKWEEDVPQTFTIEFELPETIMNLDNTEVIVLVVNDYDQSIVASDIMPASKYSDISGVNEVGGEDGIKIANEGNVLRVNAPAGSMVEAYSLDGCHLATYTVANGTLNVTTPWKGVVVVKVIGKNESKAAKLMF